MQRALQLHPQVRLYRVAIEQLQHELRQLLSEWLVQTIQVRPRLLQNYAQLFGELERTLQQVTFQAAQAQRVCEMVHLYVQRGVAITEDLLRRICQFVAAQHRIYRDERHSAPEASPPTPSGTSLSDRARECAKLYRDLVRRLHPDRCGDRDLFERFWSSMQDAYVRGDLEHLRAIHTVVCIDAQYKAWFSSSLEELEQTYRRLLYRVDYERRRLCRLQHEEPFVFSALLQQPTWVHQRRKELENAIEQQRRRIELVRAELRFYTTAPWEEYFHATENEPQENFFQDEFFKHTYFSMRGG